MVVAAATWAAVDHRLAPWTVAVLVVEAIAAALAGTALAAETFREVPVNETWAPLGVADPSAAAPPGPVAQEVLRVWAAEALVVAAAECVEVGGEGNGGSEEMSEESK